MRKLSSLKRFIHNKYVLYHVGTLPTAIMLGLCSLSYQYIIYHPLYLSNGIDVLNIYLLVKNISI